MREERPWLSQLWRGSEGWMCPPAAGEPPAHSAPHASLPFRTRRDSPRERFGALFTFFPREWDPAPAGRAVFDPAARRSWVPQNQLGPLLGSASSAGLSRPHPELPAREAGSGPGTSLATGAGIPGSSSTLSLQSREALPSQIPAPGVRDCPSAGISRAPPSLNQLCSPPQAGKAPYLCLILRLNFPFPCDRGTDVTGGTEGKESTRSWRVGHVQGNASRITTGILPWMSPRC